MPQCGPLACRERPFVRLGLVRGITPPVRCVQPTPVAAALRDRLRAVPEGSSPVSQSESTQNAGAEPPPDPNGWRREYWKRNLRLVVVLLVIWFAVSFGAGILFVEPLNQINVFGFPLGFWFAQQGSIYTFLILILVYAMSMDRLDKKFGVDENGDDAADDPEDMVEGGRQ